MIIETYTICINVDTSKLTKVLKSSESKVSSLGKKQGQKYADGFNSGASKIGKYLGSGLARIAGPAAAAFSAANIINAAKDIETASVGVGKTTGIAGKELEDFTSTLLDLGTKTGVPTQRLFEIAQVAGTLGVKGSENLLKFTDVVQKLDTATDDFKGAEAASTLQSILSLTGEGVENIEKIASVLVAAGNDFNTTEGQAASLALELSRGLATYKSSSKGILALAIGLAEIKERPEAAASSLQRFAATVEESIQEGGESLKTFSRISGLSVKEFKELFEKDAGEATIEFVKGLNEQAKAGKSITGILQDLGFESIVVRRVLGGLAIKSEEVAKAQNAANKEYEDAIAINEEYNTANNTTSSNLIKLSNSWQKFAGSLRSVVLPVYNELIELAAVLLQGMTKLINFLKGGGISDAFNKIKEGIKGIPDELREKSISPEERGEQYLQRYNKTIQSLRSRLDDASPERAAQINQRIRELGEKAIKASNDPRIKFDPSRISNNSTTVGTIVVNNPTSSTVDGIVKDGKARLLPAGGG